MLDVGCFGALQALRRELERPRNYQGNRKANDDHQHNKSDEPVRNFKKRENLGRNLDEQPCHNPIGDRNFVNIAPLQFSEEIPEIHFKFSRRLSQSERGGYGAVAFGERSAMLELQMPFQLESNYKPRGD